MWMQASGRQPCKKSMSLSWAKGTWELAALPKDRKSVGCKWVFHTKWDALGQVVHYKARLVAKGYSQVEGVDFNETFDSSCQVHHHSMPSCNWGSPRLGDAPNGCEDRISQAILGGGHLYRLAPRVCARWSTTPQVQIEEGHLWVAAIRKSMVQRH